MTLVALCDYIAPTADMKNKNRQQRSGQTSRRGKRDTRSLSNQILARADAGIPRARFLKEVSGLLLEFCGCDVLRLVLVDRERCYRCELSQQSLQSFRYEEALPESGQGIPARWSAGKKDDLEQLCADIANRSTDSSLPWFTDGGTLWSVDIVECPIPGLLPTEDERNLGIGVRAETRSLVLTAVGAGTERMGLLEMESSEAGYFGKQQVESYESVAETLGIAMAHRRLQEALRERVKELTCLYGIARQAARLDASLEDVLQETVILIPQGWLYPEVCCARIVLDERAFTTKGYRKPRQSMRADLLVDDVKRGFVEVGYTWEKPVLDEGPFLSEERSLIDAIAHEISIIVEQDQIESEKVLLQEQLHHADRLATIGQLGAGLAHELNEPLANILGYAQLVAKDNTLTDQTRQDIDKIIKASLHAREITKKLLLFARETKPGLTSIDLNALIDEGLYFLQHRCAKGGIVLSRELYDNLPEIVGERSQLLQVLTNLVVNSIQAMPHGGELIIKTGLEKNHVQLTVADTGTGISEDAMPMIFDPFFTTKDVDEGTGLGLSVVHGIVLSHKGTIEVDSELGRGTKFIVRLPMDTTAFAKGEHDG